MTLSEMLRSLVATLRGRQKANVLEGRGATLTIDGADIPIASMEDADEIARSMHGCIFADESGDLRFEPYGPDTTVRPMTAEEIDEVMSRQGWTPVDQTNWKVERWPVVMN